VRDSLEEVVSGKKSNNKYSQGKDRMVPRKLKAKKVSPTNKKEETLFQKRSIFLRGPPHSYEKEGWLPERMIF